MNFKYSVIALAALSCMTLTATAQERAAGSTLETQMTWSALSSKIKTTQDYAEGVNSKLDQAIACGKLGKLYAPGANGADPKGCKEAVIDLSTNPTIVNLTKNISTITTNVEKTTNYNTAELKCTQQGYVYAPGLKISDPNGCLKPVTGKKCTMDKASACGSATNCVVAARTPFKQKGGNYVYTQVPTTWNDGDIYIWHWDSTQNDYGGGQCIDGSIRYFTTGK